jgi:Cellulase (glycosyl hydrolase family 5)
MRIIFRLAILALLMAVALGADAPPGADRLPKIHVDRARHGFADAAGRPFVPFGVSYYRPGTGWAPQVWKQFDAEATRRDFARLKGQGGNVVRVFISFGSFVKEPDRVDPEGLAKFDRFLDLADEAGLYVHPTGPDHWEGAPAWARGIDSTDERMLKALETFWRTFAGRYRGRTTIWAYDLRNEPAVEWNTPSMRSRWDAWRKEHGEDLAPIPDARPKAPSPALAGFQHFREHLGETWVERQAAAIRSADPAALVTVGLIQWSVPAQRMSPRQYAGFRPASIARHLDFMELHFYPLATGAYRYESDAAERANLAVLESMAREASKPGLPLVIAEFGWYGGGPLEPGGKPATEEQQARWCRRLVEVTSPLACGWLNWGLYDHPQAGDVSRFTGLFTVDGKEKAWGRTFRDLARQFGTSPPTYNPPTGRPDLPWDGCIIDEEAMDRFCKSYLSAVPGQ